MLEFRHELIPEDRNKIVKILETSGFFYDFEIEVAAELIDINLEKGTTASGYHFIVASENEKVVAYCCYGFDTCTQSSYNLYWLAVDPFYKNKGIGKKLMQEVEKSVAELGGSIIWLDTAGRKLYEPTRAFYSAVGYEKIASLPDYYSPGDDKIIFMKRLS